MKNFPTFITFIAFVPIVNFLMKNEGEDLSENLFTITASVRLLSSVKVLMKFKRQTSKKGFSTIITL